ncbi:hypothetical protein ALC62_03813 [Cyphomyrmex costatus]|uniref:Uncharacterized protein n=1 Tax=Cyphomyrmex costatus TaxID=456900 RepID=A0A151IL22_9HYME|nr:hypothetical protein ALC62_03813 [Cyphomyrmex costatus]
MNFQFLRVNLSNLFRGYVELRENGVNRISTTFESTSFRTLFVFPTACGIRVVGPAGPERKEREETRETSDGARRGVEEEGRQVYMPRDSGPISPVRPNSVWVQEPWSALFGIAVYGRHYLDRPRVGLNDFSEPSDVPPPLPSSVSSPPTIPFPPPPPPPLLSASPRPPLSSPGRGPYVVRLFSQQTDTSLFYPSHIGVGVTPSERQTRYQL